MRFGPLSNSDQVLLNFSNTQASLANTAKELSSGLRINSAVDDPSGYTIAQSLQNISNGLQQGQNDVQTANNALSVADGAMASITEILQRMRTLVVEANSDINSAADKANIQAELDQLGQEVNRIAGNTNFNGKTLLDGTNTSQTPNRQQSTMIANPTLDAGGAGSQFIQPTDNSSWDGVHVLNNLEECEMSFSVDSVDPATGYLNVTWTIQSQDPTFGPPQVNHFQVQPGTNFPVGFSAPTPGNPTYTVTDAAGTPLLSFNTNNLDANDVGKTAILATVPPQSYPPGHDMSVNVGTSEGDTVSLSIGAMNSANLGIGILNVGDTLTNQASEGRLDYAINMVNDQRAQLGAQEVSLGYAASAAGTQLVQQTASESAIRDANIGQATTEFTKEQILTQVGTSVLSQMEVNTKQLTSILFPGK